MPAITRPQYGELPYPLYALFSPIAFWYSSQLSAVVWLSDDAEYLQHEAVRWRSSVSPPQKNGIPLSAKHYLESLYFPLSHNKHMVVVLLSFAPEIQVFYTVFEKSISTFIMTSFKSIWNTSIFGAKSSWTSPSINTLVVFLSTWITIIINGSTSSTNRDRQGIKLRQAIWDRVRCWIE